MLRVVSKSIWTVSSLASALCLAACEAHCPPGTAQIKGHCIVQPSAGSNGMSGTAMPAQGASAGAVSNAGSSGSNAGPSSSGSNVGASSNSSNAGASSSGSSADASKAQCADGKCETDKPNGDQCTRNEECTGGFCKNMQNGEGICCGSLGDCCATSADCPASYRSPATCSDQMNCRGTEIVAMCVANICSSMTMAANSACDGMSGPNCGPYPDVTCMSNRSNACRTSCSSDGQCDATAYCDGGACQLKKPSGGSCTMANECTSASCNNGVCCVGSECCKTAAACTAGLDATCTADVGRCQGTARSATCENSACRYSTIRVEDDRACTGLRVNTCFNYKDVMCNGMSVQLPVCKTSCETNEDCDPGSACTDVPNEQRRECRSL